MEEYEFERPKKYRVARFYRNGKISYDLFMNLSEKDKKITATKIREIVEGCNESEFVVLKEDETKGRVEVQLWKGQKDNVSGNMESKRVIDTNVNADIGHLFVSECTTNCFAIKNNTEVVQTLCEKILDFAKQQGNKSQKSL